MSIIQDDNIQKYIKGTENLFGIFKSNKNVKIPDCSILKYDNGVDFSFEHDKKSYSINLYFDENNSGYIKFKLQNKELMDFVDFVFDVKNLDEKECQLFIKIETLPEEDFDLIIFSQKEAFGYLFISLFHILIEVSKSFQKELNQ